MNDSANGPSAAYQFQQLTTYPPDVMRQIEVIYDVSFPQQERKPFWVVSGAMQRGHYDVFVVRPAGAAAGEIVAFVLLARLRTSQAMYIEYFAVAPTLRSQGIGSLLMRSTIALLKKTDSSAIVWEVDPPVTADDDNTRRIRFYERLGAHLIEHTKGYGMPDYYRGSGSLPLLLMWQPLKQDHTQPTKSELIAFVTDIYETEYPGHDAMRDEIIANLDQA